MIVFADFYLQRLLFLPVSVGQVPVPSGRGRISQRSQTPALGLLLLWTLWWSEKRSSWRFL